jgi:processive 1,2-diacylglycerol beta-glucosyltransferase
VRTRVSATVTKPTVLIISGSVGAGHDGAARELAIRLRGAGVSVDVRDYLHALPRPVRTLLRRGYTASIRYRPRLMQWLFDSAEHARWMAVVIDVLCWAARRRVRRWAAGTALVVSVFPFASQTIGKLKQAEILTCPTVTYLTDPAPHRLWVHPAVDHHLTVTDVTATAGLRDYGVAMRAVGGLVPAGFAEPVTAHTRAATRGSLGLPIVGPVVLVVAGSNGMGDIPATVATLARADIADVVVLCGRNERLRRELLDLPRVLALGWRGDVADIMAASDVLVHNAGGLSLTEAFVSGLPAVTYRPIPGHGCANAQTLAQAGLVAWPRDDDELIAEVMRQCAAGRPGVAARVADLQADVAILELLRPAARDRSIARSLPA